MKETLYLLNTLLVLGATMLLSVPESENSGYVTQVEFCVVLCETHSLHSMLSSWSALLLHLSSFNFRYILFISLYLRGADRKSVV